MNLYIIFKNKLFRYKESVGIIVISFLGLLFFLRNILIENAVIFHDEFVYKTRSDFLLNQHEITVRKIADEIPNTLYLFIYSAGSYFGDNSYIFAKLANTLFYCLAALPIFSICKMAKLNYWESLFVAIVATCLPLGIMTSYFMPESLYYFLYWIAAAFYIYSLLNASQFAAGIAGFAAISLYYVKPHAIFILLVNLVFIFAIPINNKIRTAVSNAFGIIIGYLLFKSFGWGASEAFTQGSYNQMIAGVMQRISGIADGLPSFIADAAYVATGHFFYLGIFYFLPFLLLPVVIFSNKNTRSNIVPKEIQTIPLIAKYALLQLLVLASVSILFTVLMGETGRLHFRYYSFLFPYFLLVVFFRDQIVSSSRIKFMLSLAIIIFYVTVVLFYKKYSDILNLSFVSDGAEAGFYKFNQPSAISLAGLMCLSSILYFYKNKSGWIHVALIAVLSVLVMRVAFVTQTGAFNNRFTKGREANFVEELLSIDEISNSVVVSDNRGTTSKFLFALNGLPHLEYKESGSKVDDLYAKYPDATYFIFLREDYRQPNSEFCNSFNNGMIICSKQNRLIRK